MYIGKKPTMNYVLSINTRMLEGLDKVTVKSRGKNISKAVDVAEIVTNRFITDANDDDVKLSTEEIFREDGTSTNVSTIEIVIQRN
ncbi:MAG: DNA-binding protein Alba [Methanosphaera sp.]|nr:DNA-binding protein Alba [Methanosphaera sp. ISO3-F5]MBR0472475.1 DNA-binding protein Alba [Methanosphaera sp.]WQH65312.1 DNA-binding protein Alba [Methanosphaera sp. ISO3-F5]